MKNELSWNFVALVGITVAAGVALIVAPQFAAIATFVLCLCGWLVGLCLHEYAHAAFASRFGDTSIAPRGYLTLDPIQYFHGASFLLPLIALVAGGIALPGGAVMIRTDLIRKPWQQSVVALAGPFATLACAIVAYLFCLIAGDVAPYLRDALVLLTFFNLMAFVLNLLPLPGLDGFAAILPWLPSSVAQLMSSRFIGIVQLGMLLLVFWYGYKIINPAIGFLANMSGMDLSPVADAFGRFTFWDSQG